MLGVVSIDIDETSAQILNIVVITVACSVVLHGLSAWLGSQRYGRWITDVGLGPLARYEEETTPTTEP